VDFAFVLLIARKDLARRMRDPWSLVFAVGMPLLVAGLLLLAFGGGGGGTVPKAIVLVVDHDRSLASDLLVNALGRSPTIETEAVTDTAAARARIEDGKATALVTIPVGFGGKVLDDAPVRLDVLTNPGQRILPGMVTETLAILAEAGFYLQRALGEELRIVAQGPPAGAGAFPDAQVTAVSTGINRKIGRVGATLFPPQIAIEAVADTTAGRRQAGFGALFFPGILFMALLFMAGGLASDVWVEKEAGTLRRALAAPQRARDLLAGKMLAGAAQMAAVSLLAMLFGVLAFDLPWAALVPGALWSAFSGAAFLVLLTLAHLYASSARTAGVLSTMLLFPLLMIGGSFFPFEAMPAWLARIGRLTPNGWALSQLQSILSGAAEPGPLLAAFAGLLAVGALAFLAGAARMGRGFVRG